MRFGRAAKAKAPGRIPSLGVLPKWIIMIKNSVCIITTIVLVLWSMPSVSNALSLPKHAGNEVQEIGYLIDEEFSERPLREVIARLNEIMRLYSHSPPRSQIILGEAADKFLGDRLVCCRFRSLPLSDVLTIISVSETLTPVISYDFIKLDVVTHPPDPVTIAFKSYAQSTHFIRLTNTGGEMIEFPSVPHDVFGLINEAWHRLDIESGEARLIPCESGESILSRFILKSDFKRFSRIVVGYIIEGRSYHYLYYPDEPNSPSESIMIEVFDLES